MNLNPHNPQDDKEEPEQGGSGKGPPLAIIAGLIALVALGAIGVTLAMSGGRGSNDPASESKASQTDSSSANAGPDVAPTIDSTTTAAAATPTPEPPPPPPTPTPEPPAPAAPSSVESLTSVGSGDRLVISRFGVSAPITVKTVGTDGQMPNPAGEDDVAYYNFGNWPGYGGAPGKGGNAVFAGHVDSGFAPCKYGTVPPPCTAVLWDLSKISVGDVIEIRLGGTTYRYSVVSSRSVPEKSDWGPIVAATGKETVTVITCGGDFNAATHSYDHRQVVKAERM